MAALCLSSLDCSALSDQDLQALKSKVDVEHNKREGARFKELALHALRSAPDVVGKEVVQFVDDNLTVNSVASHWVVDCCTNERHFSLGKLRVRVGLEGGSSYSQQSVIIYPNERSDDGRVLVGHEFGTLLAGDRLKLAEIMCAAGFGECSLHCIGWLLHVMAEVVTSLGELDAVSYVDGVMRNADASWHIRAREFVASQTDK
jgi:hypothetical protein